LIDTSAVRFIDSAGAALMQRVKQAAGQLGLELVFTGIGPNVRNVLRLARMESYVLGGRQ
jgi:anti-anti-sigma regulatory factor